MIETKKSHQAFQDSWFQYEDDHPMETNGKCTTSTTNTTNSSIGEEESTVSNGSTSDTTDDASSSSFSANSNSNPFRALFDMSEIMTQLPIKRGLSKFYQGKSESFTSLVRVTDLAKKANASSCRKNRKYCYKSYTLPKHVIAKKTTRAFPFPSKRL